MRITRFEILTVDIPMRMSVRHSLAERHRARNIILRARGDTGVSGWGESCPRPYVTGETIESVKKDLAESLIPRLLGRSLESFEEVQMLLLDIVGDMGRNQQAAFCACELATLDLAGKTFGVSAGSVLGPVKLKEARYSGVIATEELEGVKKQSAFMSQFGVKEVKVKVGATLDSNLKILKAASEILGSGVALRIDANGAWTGEEALCQLEAMKGFGLTGVEQPVPGDDLEGMKTVTAAGIVPVVADESLCSLDDAEILVREKACNIFNVRISKCGGLINSGRIHQFGARAGISSQLGAQVGETGLLSAAGRHFATRSAEVVWCEGSYGKLLLEEDITRPDVTVGAGGLAPALDGPGLGVEPVEERLEKYQGEIDVLE